MKYKRCVECGIEKTKKTQKYSPRCKRCAGLLLAILKGRRNKNKYLICEKCKKIKSFNSHKCCSKCQEHLMTEETKQKISLSMMGHCVSKEARQKMSNSQKIRIEREINENTNR